MICPECMVQMHQKNKLGGGEATEEKYTTWMILECPSCGRMVRETYECEVVAVCPDCAGTGKVETGEHDDLSTKKCHCKHED